MLSAAEQSIVRNQEWILTKINIVEKAQLIMKEMIPSINNCFQQANIPQQLPFIFSVPKISKGENYRKLPYVMMDYPAHFSKTDIFACRTFFWWGNFFSIQVLLTGNYKERFQENIFKKIASSDTDFYISLHESEWEHHFEADNFLPYSSVHTMGIDFREKHFIKIALRFNLDNWNEMTELLAEGYRKMTRLLED